MKTDPQKGTSSRKKTGREKKRSWKGKIKTNLKQATKSGLRIKVTLDPLAATLEAIKQ